MLHGLGKLLWWPTESCCFSSREGVGLVPFFPIELGSPLSPFGLCSSFSTLGLSPPLTSSTSLSHFAYTFLYPCLVHALLSYLHIPVLLLPPLCRVSSLLCACPPFTADSCVAVCVSLSCPPGHSWPPGLPAHCTKACAKCWSPSHLTCK